MAQWSKWTNAPGVKEGYQRALCGAHTMVVLWQPAVQGGHRLLATMRTVGRVAKDAAPWDGSFQSHECIAYSDDSGEGGERMPHTQDTFRPAHESLRCIPVR